MTTAIDFYQQQACAARSHQSWVAQLQTQACQDLQRLGFPTRRHEEWKYTRLDSFLQRQFLTATAPLSDAPDVNLPIDAYHISIVNGWIQSIPADLPEGVLVLPITDALKCHVETIAPYFSHILPADHAFQVMNTAMLQCGVLVYLPKDVCMPKPLLVRHWQDQSEQAVYARHLIIAEAGSSAVIIEDYQGDGSTSYYTNAMTELYAGQQAQITHFRIQCESKQAYHINHLAVKQAMNSTVHSHSFAFGGKLVRSDTSFNLNEPHAQCTMNGIYAPAEGQHIDHHTEVLHAVADCSSIQDYKGLLMGTSRAVFNGKVVVAKDAQRTVAKQQNKNLLLSNTAEIDTKPQLEIDANDVICTHGATVGQLDNDALFYLATRGIEGETARQLLIQAFAAENLQQVTDRHLSLWLGGLLNLQVG